MAAEAEATRDARAKVTFLSSLGDKKQSTIVALGLKSLKSNELPNLSNRWFVTTIHKDSQIFGVLFGPQILPQVHDVNISKLISCIDISS